MGMFNNALKLGEGRRIKALAGLVGEVNALEGEVSGLSDAALAARTMEFRQRLSQGEQLDDLVIEAFAVVKEAAWRVLGMRPFDVQVMGGAALHFGWVAEMRTGEGKTLVSTMPVYLNALGGRGVHVVTSNEYLAVRDAEWMGQVHRFLGLDVGVVVRDRSSRADRRAQYRCDVTYGTNSEFGFDYLRDNMVRDVSERVQRGLSYALVDEIDSILIDEARTPLIISGEDLGSVGEYRRFAEIVAGMSRGVHYEIDEDQAQIWPSEAGIELAERALGIDNLYDIAHVSEAHHLDAALKAKELRVKDVDYLVDVNGVHIVDEFTGRVSSDRRWTDGLHQAVEAKEGVEVHPEHTVIATVSLQNYFRMYDKLAGMTGTASTDAAEFASTYDLVVVPIPTHRVVRRVDHRDVVYLTAAGKWGAVIEDVANRHASGQPVLLGTASVATSELVSAKLTEAGIEHQVLNARRLDHEAAVVAQAGRLGAVTVSTNMAGRGVDILLGGNKAQLAADALAAEGLDDHTLDGRRRLAELEAEFEAVCEREREQVLALGGLYVLGTERHESRRIDDQLRGRAGRQGDVGESRFYLSFQDELLANFSTGAIQWVAAKGLGESVPLENRSISRSVERAQESVEGRNAQARGRLLAFDEVLDAQRRAFYRRRDELLEGADVSFEIDVAVADLMDRIIGARSWPLDGDEARELAGEIESRWPAAITPAELVAFSDAQVAGDAVVALAEDRLGSQRALISAGGGDEAVRSTERSVLLGMLDEEWRHHLGDLELLRSGISLRSVGREDPLTAWQRDSHEMFTEMLARASRRAGALLLAADVSIRPAGDD